MVNSFETSKTLTNNRQSLRNSSPVNIDELDHTVLPDSRSRPMEASGVSTKGEVLILSAELEPDHACTTKFTKMLDFRKTEKDRHQRIAMKKALVLYMDHVRLNLACFNGCTEFPGAAYHSKNGSTVRTVWALFNSVFWLVVLGMGVLVCALLIPVIGLTKAQRLTWRIASIFFRICLWASSVSYTVIGLENLDPSANYFFACNHQSDYDIPLIFAVVPFWLISIAKSSISYIPIFGWAVALGGTIFIQRSNHKKAVSSLNDGCKALVDRPRRALAHPRQKT